MKFRKKPVVIDAERFDPAKKPWPAGVYSVEETELHPASAVPVMRYYVNTLEGRHVATPGDWIVTGIKGERYPVKPDIFDLTYDPI